MSHGIVNNCTILLLYIKAVVFDLKLRPEYFKVGDCIKGGG